MSEPTSIFCLSKVVVVVVAFVVTVNAAVVFVAVVVVVEIQPKPRRQESLLGPEIFPHSMPLANFQKLEAGAI